MLYYILHLQQFICSNNIFKNQTPPQKKKKKKKKLYFSFVHVWV